MSKVTCHVVCVLAVAGLAALPGGLSTAQAQVLDEGFETVTETGGGIFLDGQGFSLKVGWDDGILGETAFGEFFGNARGVMTADGVANAGVDGSGAGVIGVSDVNFNLMDENFNGVTGTGGGIFLEATGAADTAGFTLNWDDGISGEGAFAGTFDGAVLQGGVSAQGLPGGGFDGLGGGQLVVDDVVLGGGGWYAGLQWDVPGFPGEARLINPGFDDNGGSLDGWGVWSAGFNVLAEDASLIPVVPLSGTHVLKMFGRFNGEYNESGAYQDMAATEGQVWQLDAFAQHVSGDSLVGTGNFVKMSIEFFDDGDNLIGTNGITALDGSSPTDVWIDLSPVEATAPAGTTRARCVFTFVQPMEEGGAGLIEDVTFQVTSGAPSIDLSRFELLADVKGTADTGAGEVFGHYQLRLEDTDGDRLVFASGSVADGSWTTIGGTLDTAEEQDSLGQPATGVFDPTSATFRVVVAFDNDVAPAWGTGGTLEVDNMLLTNEDETGSSWYGGMFWDNLPAYAITAPERLALTADVLGDVPGGSFVARVECFQIVPGGGIDESFDTVTGVGGGTILAPGGTTGESLDWDTGIEGEQAFAGTFGGSIVFGGVTVGGVTDGGVGGSGAGSIDVDEISFDPDGSSGWYGVLAWPNQTLASTDLSQVELFASVRGVIDTGFEQYGNYQLRIEDADGDYLAFEEIADGSWQALGGALSDADTNGMVGGGDGIFDPTSSTFTVAVAYESAFGWDWGGTLYVDGLFLTEGLPQLEEVGRITFNETVGSSAQSGGSSSFQAVGGLLSEGDSTFPGEGGIFWDETEQLWGVDAWDAGIEGEDAFAGFWGNGEMGTVGAEGCTDCGVDGGGGGTYYWTGSSDGGGGGGWWAGVAWRPIFAFSDLSEVRLVGDFRADWDPDEGQMPGSIYFKIESSPNNMREFRIPVESIGDGWFRVDGTLDEANPVGDLVFDGTEREYSFVVSCFGVDGTGDWGTGGTVYFDNLQLLLNDTPLIDEDFETALGPVAGRLENVDSYTVVVTMENGVETWGTEATLTVDNVQLTPVPVSCDGGDDLDVADFAVFQACFTGEGGTVGPGCECSDVDADGDADLADYAIFGRFLTGPQ